MKDPFARFLIGLITLTTLSSFLASSQAVAVEEIIATGPTISVGNEHACAITVQGTITCWGDNRYRQAYTDGVNHNDAKYTQISSGSWHNCAVTTTQEVRCWGDYRVKQTSVPAGLGKVTQVVSGGGRSCAVRLDGKVMCWGENGANQNSGVPASGVDVAAGDNGTCVLTTLGSISCTRNVALLAIPTPNNFVKAKELYAGGSDSFCSKLDSGSLTCWGNNFGAQSEVPADLGSVSDVSIGQSSTCAITVQKQLRCWGEGMGAPTNLVNVTQIAIGVTVHCAVHNSGLVNCWGSTKATTPSGVGTSIKLLSQEGMLQKLSLTSEPIMTGEGRVGATLKANPGNWLPIPNHAFKWYRIQRNIEVEVGDQESYTVQPGDLGSVLRLRVSSSLTGFLSMSVDAGATAVSPGLLSLSSTPRISGSPRQNMTLSAVLGKWDTGSVLSVQWFRNGIAITKATKLTYRLTAKDKGKKITVTVTAQKLGFTTMKKTSKALIIK